jgi:hypothetical protein
MVWSDGTNFNELQAQNLTGTLAIANGGTGQTTQQAAINALAGAQTNNRVLRSDGTNTTLSQVALATDVSGTLPVANGGTGVTTSTGSGNTVRSTSPSLTGTIGLGSNWAVIESGGILYFQYGGSNRMKLDASGNLTVLGNVTAYGSV